MERAEQLRPNCRIETETRLQWLREADALLRGIVRGALQGSCRAVERFVIALIPHTPARIDQH